MLTNHARLACWLTLLPLTSAIAETLPTVKIDLPDQPTLRLLVVGDAGTGTGRLRDPFKKLIRESRIDAILLAGDNAYPCGVSSLTDPEWAKVTINFGRLGIPVYPVLGNHDYGDPVETPTGLRVCESSSPGSQVEASAVIEGWRFPAREYVLRAPFATIVMYDSQPIAGDFKKAFRGSRTAAEEIAWIDSVLSEHRNGWLVVVGHHTIFSSGKHGITNSRYQRRVRAALLPLLERRNVDLYISGHDHDFELLGSLKREHPLPLFAVVGGGSTSLPLNEQPRPDEPPTIFPAPGGQPFVGFVMLELSAERLAITFFDKTGARRSEEFIVRP